MSFRFSFYNAHLGIWVLLAVGLLGPLWYQLALWPSVGSLLMAVSLLMVGFMQWQGRMMYAVAAVVGAAAFWLMWPGGREDAAFLLTMTAALVVFCCYCAVKGGRRLA